MALHAACENVKQGSFALHFEHAAVVLLGILASLACAAVEQDSLEPHVEDIVALDIHSLAYDDSLALHAEYAMAHSIPVVEALVFSGKRRDIFVFHSDGVTAAFLGILVFGCLECDDEEQDSLVLHSDFAARNTRYFAVLPYKNGYGKVLAIGDEGVAAVLNFYLFGF